MCTCLALGKLLEITPSPFYITKTHKSTQFNKINTSGISSHPSDLTKEIEEITWPILINGVI